MNVFRLGGVSYLRIPADDPHATAEFYATVLGWQVNTDRKDPSFEDGSGHVIGHFVKGETELRPYVYVQDVDDTLERAVAEGAEIVTPPYPEGNLRVAVFRDPAGNAIGIWQRV